MTSGLFIFTNRIAAMIEKIDDQISVYFISNHETGEKKPKYIKWQNTTYTVEKIGLHYTRYEGRTLLHMFSVTTQNHFFLISFNTQNLCWRLEQTADDNSN